MRLLMFLLLSCVGCTTISNKTQTLWDKAIDARVKLVDGGTGLEVKYSTNAELFEELIEKNKREILPPPKPGSLNYEVLTVHIERSTIGAANTKWFTYLIRQDGKEIQRQKGTTGVRGVPSTPVAAGKPWTNTDVVITKKIFKKPFQFFVIDDISKERSEYLITPPK